MTLPGTFRDPSHAGTCSTSTRRRCTRPRPAALASGPAARGPPVVRGLQDTWAHARGGARGSRRPPRRSVADGRGSPRGVRRRCLSSPAWLTLASAASGSVPARRTIPVGRRAERRGAARAEATGAGATGAIATGRPLSRRAGGRRSAPRLETTAPYPTVPEPTLPYPTVPEPTLPYPTVPEPMDGDRPPGLEEHAFLPSD